MRSLNCSGRFTCPLKQPARMAGVLTMYRLACCRACPVSPSGFHLFSTRIAPISFKWLRCRKIVALDCPTWWHKSMIEGNAAPNPSSNQSYSRARSERTARRSFSPGFNPLAARSVGHLTSPPMRVTVEDNNWFFSRFFWLLIPAISASKDGGFFLSFGVCRHSDCGAGVCGRLLSISNLPP